MSMAAKQQVEVERCFLSLSNLDRVMVRGSSYLPLR